MTRIQIGCVPRQTALEALCIELATASVVPGVLDGAYSLAILLYPTDNPVHASYSLAGWLA
jgi:hypothetical protein